MTSNEKIYKRICSAADKYATASNRPIMEAVKRIGKVCFMEAQISTDGSRSCKFCHGTGKTNKGFGPKGEEIVYKGIAPDALDCPVCGGTGIGFETDKSKPEEFDYTSTKTDSDIFADNTDQLPLDRALGSWEGVSDDVNFMEQFRDDD